LFFESASYDTNFFSLTKTKEFLLYLKQTHKDKDYLLQYIFNNYNNIDYPQYFKNGWYIGSGAIQSAKKSALQERLNNQE
jgi:hypothetical protein